MKFTKEQFKTALLTTAMVGGLAAAIWGGKYGYDNFVKPLFAKAPAPKPAPAPVV